AGQAGRRARREGPAHVPAGQRLQVAPRCAFLTGAIVDQGLLLDLKDRASRLVADFPPATTPPESLWDAQFEAGLAWVQFPLGYGGLGLDIGYADVVEELLA